MVAFQRPSSQPRPVGRPDADQVSGQQRQPEVPGAGPRLYLAVDNTRRSGDGPAGGGERPVDEREPMRSPAVAHQISGGGALVAAMPGERLLVDLEETARHWLQWGRNGLRRSGLVGRLAGSGPAVLLAVALIFGGLLAVRQVQGGPPSELAGRSTVSSAPAAINAGDGLITVQAGDSLWSIANNRFPDHDPRRVVDTLVAANGSSIIQVGQQIVVPATLIESGTLLD